VCASAGTLTAGALEAIGAYDLLGGAATAGFLAMIAWPLLLVLSVLTRALYHWWQPETLRASLVEEDGTAPKLAGWLIVILLGSLAVAWALFQGTWLLFSWTAFKPLTLSFLEPVIAVAALLASIAASRPAARLFAHLARKLPKRALRPRNLFVGVALLALIGTYLVWRLMARPRVGHVDTSILHAPIVALAMTAIAHALWPRIPRIAGAALGMLTAACVAIAVISVYTRPSTTLEIWGDQPIAGVAIERVFDLDTIRARISLGEFRPIDKPGSPHPDIILITIDTVRADHTPPYGGAADMPILRELAQRGTTFSWAFAPSNVTRRSIPSIVTGLQPNNVRGRVVGWALRLDPRHVLLAERLKAGGYDTAGFMCCKGFWGEEARTGLSRGIAEKDLIIEQHGPRLAKAARAWLDARERAGTKKPLFVWMHIIEPHNWTGGMAEPNNDDEKRRMYDKSLNASDGMVGEVVGAFAERSPEHAPIIIVTADHGEGLGDHGAPYHSTDLYSSQIRVPLVMTGPGIRVLQRVQETVSLTDLTPTIVELAGFTPPVEKLDGRSIADLATGARIGSPTEGVAFAAMIKDRSNPGGVTAIMRGNWKLIDNGVSYELYDFKGDPNEKLNRYGHASTKAIADELRKLLAHRAAGRDPF
jgi:hypothetical protein